MTCQETCEGRLGMHCGEKEIRPPPLCFPRARRHVCFDWHWASRKGMWFQPRNRCLTQEPGKSAVAEGHVSTGSRVPDLPEWPSDAVQVFISLSGHHHTCRKGRMAAADLAAYPGVIRRVPSNIKKTKTKKTQLYPQHNRGYATAVQQHTTKHCF